MNKRTAFPLLIAAALLVPGCAPKGCREDRSSGLSDASSSSMQPPVYGESAVAGTVRFEGQAPQMKVIEEARGCAGGKDVREEWAVVAPDGGLANVLVFLADAPPSHGGGRERIVLDQVDCRFVPHVLGVQVGQEFLARTSDPLLHNVHYRPQHNDHTNFSLETAGKERSTEFGAPEPEPVRIRCDVHPWMAAYVGVFAHPFYAVTDEAGRFTIERVPAGQYTLKAWHERFGTREQAITVPDEGSVNQDFTFARLDG